MIRDKTVIKFHERGRIQEFSLCKRIWDLSGGGGWVGVEGRGGRVPIPISLHSISMQLFKIEYGGHTAKTALQRGCLVNVIFLSAIKLLTIQLLHYSV